MQALTCRGDSVSSFLAEILEKIKRKEEEIRQKAELPEET